MSRVDDGIREEQLQILDSLKKCRATLDKEIAGLEYAVKHPTPPLNIDLEALAEEARKGMEFFEQCGEEHRERMDE